MAQGQFSRAGRAHRKPCVMGDALARPQGQTQARLELDEHDSPVLELFADDAFCRKAQAVTVEAQGSVKVVDADRDDGDSWFQPEIPAVGATETLG